jgi:tryptophan-rich sensory protein
MNNTIISIISILSTMYLGSRYTKTNVNNNWYNCIKPNITPPKYIFPIIWTILYILLIKVFKDILDMKDRLIIILFVINLILNVLWTYLYFAQKDVKNAFIIILLILTTSIIILYMNKNNRIIYLPYVLWIGFATYLNYLSINKIVACII